MPDPLHELEKMKEIRERRKRLGWRLIIAPRKYIAWKEEVQGDVGCKMRTLASDLKAASESL